MPVDLYYFRGSPPCHSVRLLAEYLNVKLNLRPVDYFKGEHTTAEFGKKNFLHTVPTIEDNGFIVAESRAILGYFARKYGKEDSLYPNDLEKHTIVNQRLYFDLGTLYQSYREYYGQVFTTGKLGEPAKLAKIEDAFQVLEKYLEKDNWVAGENLTIADFSIVSSVAAIEAVGDFDVSKYQNVSKWYAEAQKLPGFEEIFKEGSTLLKEYYDKYKKK